MTQMTQVNYVAALSLIHQCREAQGGDRGERWARRAYNDLSIRSFLSHGSGYAGHSFTMTSKDDSDCPMTGHGKDARMPSSC